MHAIRDTYETIIIGGGITGAATAYSLAAAGHTDVLLLERSFPAGGATAKAATLVSLARSAAEIIPYVKETFRQIDILAAGDPKSLGVFRVGAIHAASSPEGIRTLEKTFETSRQCGVFGWEIEPHQAREKLPWLAEEAVAKAYFYGDEGFVDGYLLTTAYLDAAKKEGVAVLPMCAATEIAPTTSGGFIVKTTWGNCKAGTLVLAAGAWSNLLLEHLGAAMPYAPVRSQYWITGDDPGLFPSRQPMCILPDARSYTRPENGSLVFGWREPECVWLDPHDLPAMFFPTALPMTRMAGKISKAASNASLPTSPFSPSRASRSM